MFRNEIFICVQNHVFSSKCLDIHQDAQVMLNLGQIRVIQNLAGTGYNLQWTSKIEGQAKSSGVKTKTNMWCFWMFSVFLFFWGNSCIRPNVFDVQLQGNNITKLPISKLDNVNFLFVRDIFLKCQLNCSIWWETLGFLSLFPIVTDWSQKWPLPCAPAVATMKVD